jgi:hypothetical protein
MTRPQTAGAAGLQAEAPKEDADDAGVDNKKVTSGGHHRPANVDDDEAPNGGRPRPTANVNDNKATSGGRRQSTNAAFARRWASGSRMSRGRPEGRIRNAHCQQP